MGDQEGDESSNDSTWIPTWVLILTSAICSLVILALALRWIDLSPYRNATPSVALSLGLLLALCSFILIERARGHSRLKDGLSIVALSVPTLACSPLPLLMGLPLPVSWGILPITWAVIWVVCSVVFLLARHSLGVPGAAVLLRRVGRVMAVAAPAVTLSSLAIVYFIADQLGARISSIDLLIVVGYFVLSVMASAGGLTRSGPFVWIPAMFLLLGGVFAASIYFPIGLYLLVPGAWVFLAALPVRWDELPASIDHAPTGGKVAT